MTDCNFRPISNLPTMPKLLERHPVQIATAFAQFPELQYTLQSAYRSLHSTETALLKVTDDIYRSMDNILWFLYCSGQPRHLCCLRYHWSHCPTERTINKNWKMFTEALWASADKNIPSKQAKNLCLHMKTCTLYHHSRELFHWCLTFRSQNLVF